MRENNKDEFWNADKNEVKRGFYENDNFYKCIICEKQFEKGRIYEIDSKLYDAKKTVEIHIKEQHESMLNYLLNMNNSFTGISEIQKEILMFIASGISDKEIALKMGVAQSTIRNHRYKLREKEKQAKIFLTIMELLSENISKEVNVMDKEVLCDAHKTATTVDDRYNITGTEKEKTIKSYFDEAGAMKIYPSKEKKKIIVLEEIVKNFSKGRKYKEKEINRVLKRIYDDYVTIRRALIEYGFVERSDDCSSYWVKE